MKSAPTMESNYYAKPKSQIKSKHIGTWNDWVVTTCKRKYASTGENKILFLMTVGLDVLMI